MVIYLQRSDFMTENGQPENDSKIQNEEHEHDATAKRVILTNLNGTLIGTTEPLPVNLLGATLTASVSVELDKDDDSVTVWSPTAANNKSEVTGTVSVDNFPSGFTNTISGTVSATILGGTLTNITSTLKATAYQGTDPWIVDGTFTG